MRSVVMVRESGCVSSQGQKRLLTAGVSLPVCIQLKEKNHCMFMLYKM